MRRPHLFPVTRIRSGRPRGRLALTAAAAASALLATGAPALAQAEPTALRVDLTAVEAAGPSGRIILTAQDDKTAAEVIVLNAPGASVVVHTGTCAELGSDVGLVGVVDAASHASSILLMPLATLADGAHAVAIHPGLDFTQTVACGDIPLTEIVGPVEPNPKPNPQPNPQPQPAAECAPLRTWIDATKARLDQLAKLDKDATDAAASFDQQRYLNTIAANAGALDAMVMDMGAQVVPPEAAEAHQQLMTGLATTSQALQMIIQSFTTGDPTLYQQAIAQAKSGNELVLKVRTAVGGLEAKCPATQPVG